MYKDKFNYKDTVTLVVGGRGLLGTNFCSAISELGGKVFSADIVAESKASKSYSGNKEKQLKKNIITLMYILGIIVFIEKKI